MTDSPQNAPVKPVKPVIAAGAAKRANASVIGMLLAMLSTLAIVMVIVWLNPQQKADQYRQAIDVAGISAHATDIAGFVPLAPTLPAKWYANYARWNGAGADGVAFWDVGIVTAKNSFIAIKESISANPTWIANQVGNAPVTGSRDVAGHTWEIRDSGKGDKSLVAADGKVTIILTGTAEFSDFDVLATAASSNFAQNAKQTTAAPTSK